MVSFSHQKPGSFRTDEVSQAEVVSLGAGEQFQKLDVCLIVDGIGFQGDDSIEHRESGWNWRY
jgi:hypothetical protein